MKILVIGGMHGNEPLGLKVVELFKNNPTLNVDTVLANEQAILKDRRFIEQDLNRSFPGNTSAKQYETKRAAELLDLAKRYDIVLDFHNTFCPNNDCGFVGSMANPALYDTVWLLGLTKVIVADYECINKYAPNCVSIEVSLDSKLNQPELWYERIGCLSRLETITTRPSVDRYRFIYRMTLEDKERLRLDQQDLKAFQPMPNELAEALGIPTPAFPIFVGDRYTPYNYGGVLRKL